MQAKLAAQRVALAAFSTAPPPDGTAPAPVKLKTALLAEPYADWTELGVGVVAPDLELHASFQAQATAATTASASASAVT
jgi:hypothetical protein